MIKALFKFLAVVATVIVLASCDPEYALRGGFEYQGEQNTDNGVAKENVPQKRLPRGTTESVRGTMRNIVLLMFEGHEYIIVYSSEGVAIIHSESCPCKKKKEAETE